MPTQNRKGHSEIRYAAGGQFKVYNVGSNGEITKISERLTAHDGCITNIAADVDSCDGKGVQVRDFTTQGIQKGKELGEYTLYMVRADGTTDTNFPQAPDYNLGHNDQPQVQ